MGSCEVARDHRRQRRLPRGRSCRAGAEPASRPASAGISPRPARADGPARHPADLRRDDHGLPHSRGRRAGALRHRGGHHDLRQADRRRHAARCRRRARTLPRSDRRRPVAVRRQLVSGRRAHVLRRHVLQTSAVDGRGPRGPHRARPPGPRAAGRSQPHDGRLRRVGQCDLRRGTRARSTSSTSAR